MHRPNSTSLFLSSQQYMPGGVNSPVRAFGSVGGTPVFITHAKGAYLYDADGNKYLDLINAWGPMILGHAHPEVVEAIRVQAEKGTVYGTPTELELQLAELICRNVPGIDLIRMVNSGTEACMTAIRLARGYTGRSKIIKFEGCYHGHHDSFLIKAGSGALTTGHPSSAGVVPAIAEETLLARYNDIASVKTLFENYPGQIAAIIVEPVAGNMGCVPPVDGFLQELRTLCDAKGSLLIFDEVMTGFRLAFGGAQELYGIRADLVCFGKIIGGGLPVAAFGGRRDIMEMLSPLGPVYQAGTLSGNSIGMAAGLATLKILYDHPEYYDQLEQRGRDLKEQMDEIFSKKGIPVCINQVGSMISVFFTERAVVDLEGASGADMQMYGRFFHHMLEGGVYLPPSGYESWFLGVEVRDEEMGHVYKVVSVFKR